MSDTESSGAETPAAEAVNTPSAPANPTTNPPPSTFGNTRGSGLARGKRPSGQSAQAAPAASAADYKPTAVSILTAPTEYKNPFAPPAPAAAPMEAPAAEVNVPAPTPVPTAEIPAAPAAPTEEIRPAAGETPETARDSAPDVVLEAEPKAELKILPPETPKHVEHSWESRSFRSVAGQADGGQVRPADGQPSGMRPRHDDRRGDRPVFRPDRERRGDRPPDFRAPTGEAGRSAGSEPARAEATPPSPAATPKKQGGLFGWVKKLFGGPSATEETPAPRPRPDAEFGRDGHYRRRRHRGGRGRNFRSDQQGPRDGQSGGGQYSGESRGQGGDHRYQGQHRRRRHRGGGGGGYRNDSRPEGGPSAGS